MLLGMLGKLKTEPSVPESPDKPESPLKSEI